MTKAQIKRRLAAVLAVDVAGYSRLMAADEEGTHTALKTYRRDVVDPKISRHHGHIVKTTGDGALVEFASAVDAVRCAVDIQRAMAKRNADIPQGHRVQFRIGINVGDVIMDDGDIYGDGVNIASRLEGLAETGGICISRQVYEQVESKLSFIYRPLGPQKLKNIPKPIDTYAIDFERVGLIDPDSMKLKVNYCRAPDGVRLAYATVGSGPPLVKTANWMNHVEYDWESPLMRHFYAGLHAAPLRCTRQWTLGLGR